MKKFIVSDLHGDYLIYDYVINYLNNLIELTNEEITLYINGDLIDRGYNSIKLLKDVKSRIENNNSKLKIEYLAGNHELMMYKKFTTNSIDNHKLWMHNGGDTTLKELEKLNKFEIDELVNFISNLKIYHKFEETINNKRIVLVHAKCPSIVFNECSYVLKQDNAIVNALLWTRKNMLNTIGNKDYFTIIGHTPINTLAGCSYIEKENYLNIDGGCAAYAIGLYEYDHVPLVEVENEKLTILTFNNSNEITVGNYFIKDKFVPIEKDILDEKRILLKRK